MNTKKELKEIPTTFHDWKEARRFRAWELHKKGWRQIDIAEALGVTRGAVSQWFKRVREEGIGALLSSTGTRGPKPRLSEKELQQLPKFLKRGAEAYGFRGDVWTHARVSEVIKEECKIAYSDRHIGRLLKKIGWTRQKPVERADQRDEDEIEAWQTETLPDLKKKPIEKEERSSS